FEPVERDPLQDHVFGHAAGLASEQIERRVGDSQKTTVTRLAPGAITGLVHEGQVGGDRRIELPLELGNPGTGRGPSARRHAASLTTPGHTLVAIMRAVRITERADGNELIHDLRDVREEFADLYSRNFGLNRLEFAADFNRSARLEVPHVEVRRTAG